MNFGNKNLEKKIKNLAKKQNNTITSAQLRKLLTGGKREMNGGKPNSISCKEYKKLLVKENRRNLVFSYNYEIKFFDDAYIVTITGNTYSKNVMDNWHRGIRLKYKKAIRIGVEEAKLKYKKNFEKMKPFKFATLSYTFYNTHSRDWDNNECKKQMQDSLTLNYFGLGLIEDDKIINIGIPKQKETIHEFYKVEILVEKSLISPS